MWWLALVALAEEPAPNAPLRVNLDTTEGPVVLLLHPEWAPRGAARFAEAVDAGVYDGAAFFRVLDGFVAQFGIPADPAVSRLWRDQRIPDDPVATSNRRGTVSFAMSGPNTRTTQVFINLVDNPKLDAYGFAPFAEVEVGMDVIAKLYSGYGEGFPAGHGPDQTKIQESGGDWLAKRYPKLDVIRDAQLAPALPAPAPAPAPAP